MENEPRRRAQLSTPRVGFGDRDRVQFRSSILCNFRSSMTQERPERPFPLFYSARGERRLPDRRRMQSMRLMRTNPPFWMPERRRQTVATEDLYRDDRDP